MKNTEIRELTDKELKERIRDEKELKTKLAFSNAVSPIDNPNKMLHNKKTVARLLTELRKREIAKQKI